MKEKQTKITDLCALVVFAVFAVCLLIVLLGGAKVYRNIVRTSEESFEDRTTAQYVTTRVRQAGSVAVADFFGCEALVIPEEIDGARYITYVYYCDGYIRELFCSENAALQPEDGEKVIPAESLRFSIADGLLTVHLDDREIFLSLTGKEAAP